MNRSLTFATLLVLACATKPAAPTRPIATPDDFLLAENALKAEEWPLAEKRYLFLAQAAPQRFDVWLGLGLAQARLGKLAEAADDFERSYGLKDNGRARTNLGILVARGGRVDLAEELFLAAVQVEPSYVPGWASLARAQLALGDLGSAAIALRQGEMVKPDDSELRLAHSDLDQAATTAGVSRQALLDWVEGLTLSASSHPEAATQALLHAVEGAPHQPHLHLQLGLLARRGHDVPTAERELRAALSLAPESAQGVRAEARAQLAALLVEAHQGLPEAQHLIQEAIEIHGEKPEWLETLGEACASQGDLGCATKSLQRALAYEDLRAEQRARLSARLAELSGDAGR
jgi:tetratricopeptide (TPR) repeat protein